MAKREATTTSAPAVNDAYTGMLAISLFALIGGCVFLYLEFSQYPDTQGPKSIPKSPLVLKAEPQGGGGAPAPVPVVPPKADPKVDPPKVDPPKVEAPKADGGAKVDPDKK